MENITLQYGDKIQYPSTPMSYIVPQMGISVKSTNDLSNENIVEYSIDKYFQDDTNANEYKIRLIPIDLNDRILYGDETFYSSDLKLLINKGIAKLV